MQGRGWGKVGDEEMVEAQFTWEHQNHLEIHDLMNLVRPRAHVYLLGFKQVMFQIW